MNKTKRVAMRKHQKDKIRLKAKEKAQAKTAK
jgi:hypothetical protein